MVLLTGWRQSTGETFRTSKEPEPLPLSNSAPGFVEGLGLMKKGERAMLWLPPELGYREKPKTGVAEALVYEIEIVNILEAPPVPADVATPPATAQVTPLGTKYVVVKPGGTDKPRPFDTVTYHYTAWDASGRMFDTSELRKKPATIAPLKQSPVIEEMLLTAAAGSRVRFWLPAEKINASGKPLPSNVTGQVTYEVEVLQVSKAVASPPPKPADLARPPAAPKSPKGVAYRVLKPGKGPKCGPTDVVRAKYTGWTADGRIFETWVTRGEPMDIAVNGTMAGFSDVLPLLSIGDTARLWVPEQLAYQGAPGKPQGPLVYDLELVEIRAPEKADPHGAHGDDDGHGHGDVAKPQPVPPAPPDVAAPPKDAKKTALGVFYKVQSAGKGGPKPTPTDRVKVHYTGWSTTGESFDSSFKRGKPAEFALTGVIAGWTDGLQVMSVGDKVRFWIPEEHAYKGSPGKPQGMLVFDIELLEIKPGGMPGGHP
jgi:peptidylprolyl isomerase